MRGCSASTPREPRAQAVAHVRSLAHVDDPRVEPTHDIHARAVGRGAKTRSELRFVIEKALCAPRGRHAGHCIAAQRDPSAASSSATNCGLIEHTDIEPLGLLQLAPRRGPGNHRVGLAADARARVAAERADPRLGVGAAHPVEAPGDHPGLTAPRATAARRAFGVHARGAEMLEHRASLRSTRTTRPCARRPPPRCPRRRAGPPRWPPRAHRCCRNAPRGSRRCAHRHDGSPSALMNRASGTRRRDAIELDQLGGGPLRKSVQRQQLLGGEPEQIGRLGDIPEVDELIDDRRTQAFDVHRAACGEVDEQLAPLRGTERIQAAPHHLPLLAHEQRVAGGAVLGHLPRGGPLGTLLEDHSLDLGDDVACLVDQHRVADAHVLARHLVLVVEGAAPNRGTRDQRGFQDRDRRHGTGAPDLDVDVEHLRLVLLGRELVGDRPARCARDRCRAPPARRAMRP